MAMIWPFTVFCCLTSAAVVGVAAGTGPAGEFAHRSPLGTVDTLQWNRLEGLWDLDDGRRLVVTDLTDQMPDNAHQLMVLEPESGWVRTLYAESGRIGEFSVGAGFFQVEPAEGRLEFGLGTDAASDSLVWSPGAGDPAVGRRSLVREREIRFDSGGTELAGSLLLPPDSVEPPYPALVFVHGSGPLTRRSPRQVGYQMAAAGIAAITFDKRGTGASGGAYRLNAVEDAGRDAVAALDFAKRLPELDPERIGVHAASEGGYVAPAVLGARPDVAAFICRVCPILPWSEALPYYLRGQLEAQSIPDADIRDAMEYVATQTSFALDREPDLHRELLAHYDAAAGEEWLEVLGLQRPAPPDAPSWNAFREFLSPDPTEMYPEISMPALVVLGGADPRIPGAVHGARARELLRGSASPAWEVWVLPGANHGLMSVRAGPDGGDLAPRSYAPEFHPRLVEWARRHLGGANRREP